MKKLLFVSALVLSAMSASAQDYTYERDLVSTDSEWHLNFGYVNKEWITDFHDGEVVHENFWGEPDKKLHGMQFGFDYMPKLSFGLGLKTGAYFEYYTSVSDYVLDRGWDRFSEYGLYFPLQLMWDIRCTDYVSIQPYAGLGFNWSMYGNFEEDWSYRYGYYYDSYYEPHEYEQYGKGNPKRWNNQLEYGVMLKFNSFVIGAAFSKGFRDHELYDGYKSYQDKFTITLGLTLDD